MKKWEYQVINHRRQTAIEDMNSQGREGWEVMSIETGLEWTVVWYKREVE